MLILMLLGVLITSCLAYFIFRKANKNLKDTRKIAVIILSFIIFACGLEATIFNINFYNTRGNEEIDLSSYLSYHEVQDKFILTYENNTLYFPELNENVNNLHLDVSPLSSNKTIPVSIKFSDEANIITFTTPERAINGSVKKSHYINLHPSGKISGMTVTFSLDEGDVLVLNGASLNAKRPFEFSFVRIFLVLGLLGFLYLFAPSSKLYKKPFSKNKDEYTLLATFLICVQCCIFAVLGTINPLFLGITLTDEGLEFTRLNVANHNMYDELAVAILDGKAYIDNNDVPDSLKNITNPYDTTLRNYTSQQTGDKYRWDVAYFDGHYFVYFGIVPLLLMYLPFRAFLGAPFPTALGIIVFAILFTIGVYKLLTLLAEKKFKNVSIGNILLLLLVTVNSCGVMFLVKRPDFYSIPILTGITFSIFGIYNWLYGIYNEKHKALRFLLGSLCMALVAGCRPQLLLLSFLAFPIFFKRYILEKEIKSKKGMKELALLLSPYIIVAAGLMYYNYIRFNSPFDFGANYQLTTNDVTKRGFDLGRTGLGFFTYLFQPPVISAKFPFLEKVAINTNYVGKTIFENCFGGLITSTPILWLLLFFKKSSKALKEKKLLAPTILLLLFGFIIVFFNTQAGGLLQRYVSDFGFIFFGAALLIILALLESRETDGEKDILNSIIFLLSILSIIYNFALAFSVSDVTIDKVSPNLFTYLSETVQFWL